MNSRDFTCTGRVFCDPVGYRTWIEIDTGDGLSFQVGFKGECRTLDRYRLVADSIEDHRRLCGYGWCEVGN